ncbi:MAG: penicillin-binding protein 2 [Holosporales bacterium]|jgi:penicillin-binding protein 2|nr:penicillin-binding protein 2 [Holosporales bacterium]
MPKAPQEHVYRPVQRFRRLFFFEIGAFLLLIARLVFLQFWEDTRYSLLSQKNCVRFVPILPQRGNILDKEGKALAANVSSYRLFLENSFKERREEILTLLQKEIPLSKTAVQSLREECNKKPHLSLILVQDALSWEQVSRLVFLQSRYSELHITLGYARSYPYEELFGAVTGYIGAPESQEAALETLARHPDYRVGKAGMERTFNSLLLGSAGFRKVEIDATGRVVRQLEHSPAVRGTDLKTTLDAPLQSFVYALLKPYKAASCVIIEVPSGAIRCLVSVPSYAPTALSQGESGAWRRVLQDPEHPLLARATAGQYPPASTFKIVTLLAALEAGFSPQEKVFCPGYLELGTHKFHCWHKTGHGALTMAEAMHNSCDVYFFSLAKRLGLNKMTEVARKLGLGEIAGVLYGEAAGLIPSRAWKLLRQKESWSVADTILIAIGQGPILVTPLQLAILVAHVANKGQRVHPTLEIKEEDEDTKDLGFRPETIEFLKKTLIETCTIGTGRRAQTEDPTVVVAGKTGTAQVRRISARDRERNKTDTGDRSWEERDHALFVGYASRGEKATPKYAIALVVEHGGKGGGVAAPLAKQIFERLLPPIVPKE